MNRVLNCNPTTCLGPMPDAGQLKAKQIWYLSSWIVFWGKAYIKEANYINQPLQTVVSHMKKKGGGGNEIL